MSAERLREAAKVLRARPSWHVVEITDGRNATTAYRKDGRFYLDRQGDEFGTERVPLDGQTGEFYPLANPGVGLALADWLDATARFHETYAWPEDVAEAHKVADLILGDAP